MCESDFIYVSRKNQKSFAVSEKTKTCQPAVKMSQYQLLIYNQLEENLFLIFIKY